MLTLYGDYIECFYQIHQMNSQSMHCESYDNNNDIISSNKPFDHWIASYDDFMHDLNHLFV